MHSWKGLKLFVAVFCVTFLVPAYPSDSEAENQEELSDKKFSKKLAGEKEKKIYPQEHRGSPPVEIHGPPFQGIPPREAPADIPPANSDEEETKAIEQKKEMFEKKHGVPLTNDQGEINYDNVKDFSPNEFYDGSTGNPNQAGPIPEDCKTHQSKNPEGITFVQPASVGETGAVLFGGQACAGVKRRDGNFNNWPSEALNGATKMTPDGVNGKSSANYNKGSYGPPSDPSLKPIWLGSSGAVQIHSLATLQGNRSLAGISSMGCLVVNQNCMKAINAFLNNNPNLKFSIIGSNPANSGCTNAVNKPNPNI